MFKGLLLLVLMHALTVSADSSRVIPMVKHKSATFYVGVTIGDLPSKEFVIDTGASHVTISRKTLQKLLNKKQAIFVRSMKGILANGASINVPVYKISSLNIGGGCQFKNVEVAVIERDVRGVLGLSALNRAAPFTFSVDPPQLQLSNCA